MRVVCSYVEGMLRDETRRALARFGSGVEYEQIPADDPLAYGRAVARLWRECGERFDDLCLIEQDVEVGPSTLYDFRACQHGWCGSPYPWLTNVGVALGCTRWKGWFVRAFPSAADEAFAMAPHFRQFDVALVRRVLIAKYGEQPHVHAPVVHLNAAKALRDGADPEPLVALPGGGDIGELL